VEKLNTKLTIEEAMKLALNLAKKGLGFVEPNPAVGCVILNTDEKLIGYGYHEKFGEPHAEVNALMSVRDKEELKGARVIVTLEPCGHSGKTPPCSEALIKAGIGTLVYGVSDPNPLFDHSGLADLKKNSISVKKFNSSDEILKKLSSLVERFIFSQKKERAFVSLKIASSLDGQIALKNKKSKWITGDKSREHSHLLRATHDATLIGVGTLIDDDPSLDIRLERLKHKKNKVIIFDPNFRSEQIIKQSKLMKSIGTENIFIASTKKSEVINSSLRHIEVSLHNSGNIVLNVFTKTLLEFGIKSVLVEGGAGTTSEFLKQNAFDRIYAFIAPSIIGAGYGLSWSKDLQCEDLDRKIKLSSPEIELFGDDILLSYTPNN